MFSLFKLLWLKDNRIDIWDKTYKFLYFEDMLQFRFGIKNPAMGWPLAGRTMLFDVRKHQWSAEILSEIGLDANRLARPLKSGSISGYISSDVADRIGLSKNTFVVTGGHDQTCCALGAGATNPGVAAYSSGTVECITPAFAEPVFSDSLFESNLCTYDHTADGLYASVAFSLTGGNVLKWFRDQFGYKEIQHAKDTGKDPYELLLSRIDDKPSDLLVLPYFTPSGTPYFDAETKGAILGLRLSTKKEDILRALLEGVALEMRLNLDILEKSGCRIDELRIIGGGAKSDILNQLKADVLGKKITVMDVTEAGCMGAAMLAKAAEDNRGIRDIAKGWCRPVNQIKPNKEFSDIYQRKFKQYKNLYLNIKSLKIG
jgi:xylulokinase